MWVRLTRNSYNAVLNSVALDAAVAEALMAEVVPSRKTMLDVEAPYAAWKFAASQLRRRAFGPRGGRLSTVPHGVHTSLQVITRALNYMDTHPALRDVGVLGWAVEEIPAWRTGDEDLRYSPYPIPGNEFVMLLPTWVMVERQKATQWVPRSSGQGRLAHEQLHLALWRNPVA